MGDRGLRRRPTEYGRCGMLALAVPQTESHRLQSY